MFFLTQALCSALVLCFAATVLPAQTSVTPEAPPPIVRAQTRLVVLDVLVTDKQGSPVTGLSMKDFELREDGVQRTLRSAEEHAIAAPGGSAVPASAPAGVVPTGSGVFSNRPPAGDEWNVLLLDALNPSWEVQASARQQLIKFVQQLPPEQPIALVMMGSPSRLVVPFNAGAAGILKFLTGKKPSSYSTVFLATDVGTPLVSYINSKQPNAPLAKMEGPKGSGIDPRAEAVRKQNFRQVLDTFAGLADWLSHYPGRKNVYWLTDGFPGVQMSEALSLMSPKRREGPFFNEIQQMNKLLQNARVAVSPIDISGVRLHNSFGERVANLQDIAEETGGVLRINNNDIPTMLREEFNRSQDFYTLSYTPSSKNWNGQYRKIALTLKQLGYQLAYRQGYYAVDANFKPPTMDDFKQALNHGAEQVNDVIFSVHTKIDASNVILDYSIDPHSLEFTAAADGHHRANVDCVVTKYDSGGKLLGTARTKGVVSVPAKKWPNVYVSGIPGHEIVPLEGGVAFMKVGVRDSTTGRFGTLELSLGSRSSSR
jgi:VWFA-related protein